MLACYHDQGHFEVFQVLLRNDKKLIVELGIDWTNFAEQIISSHESSDSNLLQKVFIRCVMFINCLSMDQGLLQILLSETYMFLMCFY